MPILAALCTWAAACPGGVSLRPGIGPQFSAGRRVHPAPPCFPAVFHHALRGAVRAEIRANLKLALPLIAAQLAGVGMGAIDTIFAGRLGAQALAAVAVGVNFNVIFFVLFMGLFMACSPVVAHMVGAGRAPADIGAFIRKARGFAWIAGAVWVVLLNLSAAPALRQLHLDPQTTDLAITFVRTLSGSAFGLSLWFTLRFSAEGLGQVRPILYAGLVGLCCNILLDWLLLFGHFGLPRLGAPGCGVATTVSSLAMAGTLYRQFRRVRGLRERAAGQRRRRRLRRRGAPDPAHRHAHRPDPAGRGRAVRADPDADGALRRRHGRRPTRWRSISPRWCS